MKLNKILFSALMLSAINGAMTSCSDSFLEEDQITQYDTSYFNTQEGLDGLVTGAYEKLKFKFNYVWLLNVITWEWMNSQMPIIPCLLGTIIAKT